MLIIVFLKSYLGNIIYFKNSNMDCTINLSIKINNFLICEYICSLVSTIYSLVY